MLKDFIVIKTLISFIVPYIILYAIYIQLNGEISPGGGFQAGVIFASGFIGWELIRGQHQGEEYHKALIICATLGVLIYASCGLISFLNNENYLNYDSIAKNTPLTGQHLGIFAVELGVGLTVSSIMYLIYLNLRED